MSRRLLLFTLILLIIISSNLIMNNQKVQSKEKEIKYKENSALALNYHRIRNDNFSMTFYLYFQIVKNFQPTVLLKSNLKSKLNG